LLKLVPHSPPPSPPQPATKAWVNSSWVFLSHSTQLNSHAESAVQHRCQFWSAKPNPLSSAFKIRVGTQLLFILCCMHHFHGPNPTSSYTIFMFQTLHSKFNSGVFRILKEIQIFFLQSNSKTFHIYIYIYKDLEFISNCYSQTKQCSFTPSTSFYRRNHLGMKIFNIKICNIFS
jgi:hypothetical protein